jgi:hypothetical protein
LKKHTCYIAYSGKRIQILLKIFDKKKGETTDEARETAANHNNAGIVIPVVMMIVSRKNL